MPSKRTSFADYQVDGANWITLATGEYYPDILPEACELYKPVLVMFDQILKRSESSIALFKNICELREQWMRIQLARVFRKYVSPSLSVELLKKKTQVASICQQFAAEFRPIQDVQRAFRSRPIPDEALAAVLWEYKDRGQKGYDLTERFFKIIRGTLPGLEIVGPERAGKDVLLGTVWSDYPKPDRPADFIIRRGAQVLAVGFARYDSDRGGAQEDDRTGGYRDCARELLTFAKRKRLSRLKIVFLNDGPGLLLGSMWSDSARLEALATDRIRVVTLRMVAERITRKWLEGLSMATGVPPKKRKQTSESYELAYPGKMPCQDVLGLKPTEPQEIDTRMECGRLYRGDSLNSLLWLRKDASVRGQVRCVYIDPPYATSQAFQDRDDNHAYDDTLTGADYVEFMRRCLIVIHDLLADNGVIFVHLDQKMVFEMKLLLDEVIGRNNFRNFITRKKCNTKNYTRRQFGNISDHILFYSKSTEYVWHRPYDKWSAEKIENEYPYFDDVTGKRYKRVPLHAPGVRNGATGTPWRGKQPPPGKHWQYPPATLERLDRVGEIYWSRNGNPRRKVFLEPNKGIPAQDIWTDYRDAHNQNILITGYPTEKNFDLICRLVAATSNPNDLVLDCFCGSGTTLEAAASLGRRFLGIDNSDAAIAATVKRLRHGRERMGDYVAPKKIKKRPVSDQKALF